MPVIEARSVDSSDSNFILGAIPAAAPLVLFPISSGDFTIGSDSNDEGPAGIGVRSVFVAVIYEGDPGVFTIEEQTIALAQGSTVPGFSLGGLGVRRIREMRDATVGNQEIKQPQGVITASVSGVPCSQIIPGRGRSEIAVWTTGPSRVEHVESAAVGVVSEEAAGMDWQIRSEIFSRLFSVGEGFIGTGPLWAREPGGVIALDFMNPLKLGFLQDIVYEIGITSGVDRSIHFNMRIEETDSDHAD